MKDFFDKNIELNDFVIYIKGMRTGSSSSRKVLLAGKVIKVNDKKVKIQRRYTNEHCEINVIDTVFPKDIVVMENIYDIVSEEEQNG